MKLPKVLSRYNTRPNVVAVVVILFCAFTWWLRSYYISTSTHTDVN